MTSSEDTLEGVLTEATITRASRQYDIEVIFSLNLHNQRLHSLSDALSRCCALSRLDISRNSLTSLAGIAALGGSLVSLNAAENQINSIKEIETCGRLEEAFLEGNQLREEAALFPLTGLTSLRHLRLRREISLNNNNNNNNNNINSGGRGNNSKGNEESSLTLTLDNPICADVKKYEAFIRRYFAAVLIVDGCCFRSVLPEEIIAATEVPLVIPGNVENEKKNVNNIEDDLDERIFANALAECRAACRKAMSV